MGLGTFGDGLGRSGWGDRLGINRQETPHQIELSIPLLREVVGIKCMNARALQDRDPGSPTYKLVMFFGQSSDSPAL